MGKGNYSYFNFTRGHKTPDSWRRILKSFIWSNVWLFWLYARDNELELPLESQVEIAWRQHCYRSCKLEGTSKFRRMLSTSLSTTSLKRNSESCESRNTFFKKHSKNPFPILVTDFIALQVIRGDLPFLVCFSGEHFSWALEIFYVRRSHCW